MARGPYKDTLDVQLVRGLIAFAHGEASSVGKWGRRISPAVRARLKAKVPESWLRIDLQRFFHVLARWNAGEISRDDEHAVQGIVLQPVLSYRRGRPPGIHVDYRPFSESPSNALRCAAFVALEAVGLDRLLRCPAPACGRLFLKIGRRAYCCVRCQHRVLMGNQTARDRSKTKRRKIAP
jgi:hypothetical protein